MKVHPDKVREYVLWFITNEIIKYGGSELWNGRKECRCGAATWATIVQAENPGSMRYLDCDVFIDPYYPEGKLVFWPGPVEIPDIPYALL